MPPHLLVYVCVVLRATALEGSLAQYAFGDSMQLQYPLNTTAMVAWFEETHTNPYSYLVCDRPASDASLYDYAQFISLLSATAALRVDGTAFRVWITLIPPTGDTARGAGSGSCAAVSNCCLLLVCLFACCFH